MWRLDLLVTEWRPSGSMRPAHAVARPPNLPASKDSENYELWRFTAKSRAICAACCTSTEAASPAPVSLQSLSGSFICLENLMWNLLSILTLFLLLSSIIQLRFLLSWQALLAEQIFIWCEVFFPSLFFVKWAPAELLDSLLNVWDSLSVVNTV